MVCAIFTGSSPCFRDQLSITSRGGIWTFCRDLGSWKLGKKMTMHQVVKTSPFFIACMNDTMLWFQSWLWATFHHSCEKFSPKLVRTSKVCKLDFVPTNLLYRDWTFEDCQFCVQLCLEKLSKRATLVAYFINFSVDFFSGGFHPRSLSTLHLPWCKEVQDVQKAKSGASWGPALTWTSLQKFCVFSTFLLVLFHHHKGAGLVNRPTALYISPLLALFFGLKMIL